MKDKVEIGLIRTGTIAMYLAKYAELIETLEKHGIVYHGHDDADDPRRLSEWLYGEGHKIEKALLEAEHEGEEYPL